MIYKEQMMPLLVEANPEFKPEWEAFVKYWGNESDELPLYLSLGDYSLHLIEKLSSGETENFSQVFEVVERLHLEGEHYVKEAATVGLLEGIQNVMLNRNMEPERFRSYLQPETLRWWDKLYDFWNEGKLLTDD